MLQEIEMQARQAMTELVEAAHVGTGDIVVVGCSSSEVSGQKIGSYSSPDIAQAIWNGLYPVVKEKGLYLAAQCCEHLNRAIIIERDAAEKYGLEIVNAVPQPKAGGSFATVAYQGMEHPVTVEEVKAHCGMDIGGTLIGMHLRKVAVPVRLPVKNIGEAPVLFARTRPKFIGGVRARYDDSLL